MFPKRRSKALRKYVHVSYTFRSPVHKGNTEFCRSCKIFGHSTEGCWDMTEFVMRKAARERNEKGRIIDTVASVPQCQWSNSIKSKRWNTWDGLFGEMRYNWLRMGRNETTQQWPSCGQEWDKTQGPKETEASGRRGPAMGTSIKSVKVNSPVEIIVGTTVIMTYPFSKFEGRSRASPTLQRRGAMNKSHRAKIQLRME